MKKTSRYHRGPPPTKQLNVEISRVLFDYLKGRADGLGVPIRSLVTAALELYRHENEEHAVTTPTATATATATVSTEAVYESRLAKLEAKVALLREIVDGRVP